MAYSWHYHFTGTMCQNVCDVECVRCCWRFSGTITITGTACALHLFNQWNRRRLLPLNVISRPVVMTWALIVTFHINLFGLTYNLLQQNDERKIINNNKFQNSLINNKTLVTHYWVNTHTGYWKALSPYNTIWHRRRVEFLFWTPLKIDSLCNTYKYPVTNQVTTTLHQKHSNIRFRILLNCWILLAH